MYEKKDKTNQIKYRKIKKKTEQYSEDKSNLIDNKGARNYGRK